MTDQAYRNARAAFESPPDRDVDESRAEAIAEELTTDGERLGEFIGGYASDALRNKVWEFVLLALPAVRRDMPQPNALKRLAEEIERGVWREALDSGYAATEARHERERAADLEASYAADDADAGGES